MKKQISKAPLILTAGLALLLALPAAGQSFHMRIQTPFAFLAGGQMHQAGSYAIELDAAFHTLQLRSTESTTGARVPMKFGAVGRRTDQDMPAIARFRQLGGVWSLDGVWATGARDGYVVQASRREAELAKAGGGTVMEIKAVR